jgi:hypothetical protein
LLPRKAILAGFLHVTLGPGESRLVSVPVDPDAQVSGDRVEYWLYVFGEVDSCQSIMTLFWESRSHNTYRPAAAPIVLAW